MDVVLAAVISGVGCSLLTWFVFAGPIPIIDKGSRIYTVADEASLNSVVRVLADLGLRPRFRIFSTSIKRAVMADNVTIINCTTDSDLWKRMGMPAAALALVKRQP